MFVPKCPATPLLTMSSEPQVRHPHVHVLMERDFELMTRFARMARRLPLLRDMRLDESIRQFGAPMREQLDLSEEASRPWPLLSRANDRRRPGREYPMDVRQPLIRLPQAKNLARFNRNFSRWARSLSFPRPIYPLVAPEVLVETFEEGTLINTIVDGAEGLSHEFQGVRKKIALAGLNSYFKVSAGGSRGAAACPRGLRARLP